LLPWYLYYFPTLALFAMNIIVAILVPKIEILIGFVGSLSTTVLNAILPGIFYIVTSKKNQKLQAPRYMLLLAGLLSIYGLAMSIISTTMRIINLINESEK